MQLLCPPCHTLKTNEDNLIAAQAAMSMLFWKVFGMPLPWTVDALEPGSHMTQCKTGQRRCSRPIWPQPAKRGNITS
jgi:hypothetical protein